MTTRLHGWNRLAQLGRAYWTVVVPSVPLLALMLLDLRLGLAAVAGGAVGVLAMRQVANPSELDHLWEARLRQVQARDRLRDIEVESLEGKVADLERRLEGERSHHADLLGVFDKTEDVDAERWLTRIRNHMRVRHEASEPNQRIALGDVFARCVGGAGWATGGLTVTESLPLVVAPPGLVATIVESIFEDWSPIGPVAVGGRVDGGMAVVSVRALGLSDRVRRGELELTRLALEELGGSLFTHDGGGLAFALPLMHVAA